MYRQDSFFDLTPWGQFGLLCLSLTLFGLFVLVARTMLHQRRPFLRVIGALTLFWLFVWLSPQVYYQYYSLIIPDLPVQWVIWPPRGLGEALQLLLFAGPKSLSAHGQGLLGWSLIIAPFLKFEYVRRGTAGN
ncbi:MAG: hypothetical protein AAFQ66_04395 [Pseudomonadota bacterium]